MLVGRDQEREAGQLGPKPHSQLIQLFVSYFYHLDNEKLAYIILLSSPLSALSICEPRTYAWYHGLASQQLPFTHSAT